MPKVTSKKQTARKPRVVKKDQQKITCCICISDIDTRTAASIDCCDHKYCTGCITQWANTENSCPQCKKKFKSITALKKNCKRKTVSTNVEDKRQRPDNPDDPDPTMQTVRDIIRSGWPRRTVVPPALSVALNRIVAELCVAFDRTEGGVERYFSLPQEDRIVPWDLPTNILYRPAVRMYVLIHFFKSRSFRHQTLRFLIPDESRPQELTIAAQMVFNIINRFVTLVQSPYSRNQYRMWAHIARVIVFSGVNVFADGFNQNDFIHAAIQDLDNPYERPPHDDLTDNRRICTHRNIIQLFCNMKNEDSTTLMVNRNNPQARVLADYPSI